MPVSFAQTEVDPVMADVTGMELTVTIIVSVPVQLPTVPVTTNVYGEPAAVRPESVMEEVVALLLQR